jgi:hypothetical protein
VFGEQLAQQRRDAGLAHGRQSRSATDVIKPTALTVGVGGLVQRTYRTQDLARISVDQVDMTEIPSRVPQTHALQVPVR